MRNGQEAQGEKMIKLITAPATEPVTSTEAKAQCKVDTTADDTLIASLIKAARRACEEYTRTAIITQTWDLQLDEAEPIIWLPRPPLATVTGVYVTDDAGTETTVSSSVYRTDTTSTPGRIMLKPGNTWPYYTSSAGFRVRYTAGYTAAANVPDDLKQAVLMLVSYLYANRGDSRGTVTFAGQQGQLPDDVKVLLDPFKVYI